MGINFEKITKGKVGDIIYPAYNETNGFWQKPRWDLVVEVDDKNNIIDRRYIWDVSTVNAIKLTLYLLKLKGVINNA